MAPGDARRKEGGRRTATGGRAGRGRARPGLVAAALAVAGCTQGADAPGLSRWDEVRAFAPAPIDSDEIRARIVGTTLRTEPESKALVAAWFGPDGVMVQRRADVEAYPGGIRRTPYSIQRNGVWCIDPPDHRYCYRLYVVGDRYMIVDTSGRIRNRGVIVPGDADRLSGA